MPSRFVDVLVAFSILLLILNGDFNASLRFVRVNWARTRSPLTLPYTRRHISVIFKADWLRAARKYREAVSTGPAHYKYIIWLSPLIQGRQNGCARP